MKPIYRNRLTDYGGPHYRQDDIAEATRWAREAEQREQDARNGNGAWFLWGFIVGFSLFVVCEMLR